MPYIFWRACGQIPWHKLWRTVSATVALCGLRLHLEAQNTTVAKTAAAVEEEADMAFIGVLPSEVHLADDVATDDGVVVAGQLTNDEIIITALGEADEASEEDLCDG